MHDLHIKSVIIALGSNAAADWGSPQVIMQLTICRLAERGFDFSLSSRLYSTRAFGPGMQARYLNAVVCGNWRLPVGQLLRELKAIEREAGRRTRMRNSARPLDLDLIAHGGRQIAWSKASCRHRRALVLPHPLMHQRAFVLRPLLDVAPHWWHPALGKSARRLLANLKQRPHEVEPVLDSGWPTCEKNIR